MRRIALVVLFAACSCARATPPRVTAAPSAPPTTAPSASSTVASTPPPSNDRWVDVSVATVWTLPTSARAIDAPTLGDPADPRRWLAHLTNAQKLALVGRVQTQVLYGERVRVTETSGAWSHIVIPDQPSQKDARGYPGWVPTVQLTSRAPRTGATVRIAVPTLNVGGTDLSYGTQLPLVAENTVQLLDGRRVTVPSGSVSSSPALSVLVEARRFLGLPYMWGGTSAFGFDCSGFTMLVYRSVGIALARDTDQQVHDGRTVAVRDVRPGDLLFVTDLSGAVVHEAIYVGSGKIIESPHTGLGVRIVPLGTHTYVAARRVLPG